MTDRKQLKDMFLHYTAEYDMTDPKIRLKAEHTYRVAALSERIARDIQVSEKLSEADIDLAWMIGMLHDIGRFEQVRRYGSFWDATTVDHAEFGADLLFGQERDPKLVCDLPDPQLIETAIRNHNKYRIAQGLSPRETMFCNIIRDADKIDILRVNTEFTPMEIYGVTEEEILQAKISDEVLQQVLEGKAVDRRIRQTPMDTVVSHASMMQELVFPISRSLVKEQGYLAKLLDRRPTDPETVRRLAIIREHLKEMI